MIVAVCDVQLTHSYMLYIDNMYINTVQYIEKREEKAPYVTVEICSGSLCCRVCGCFNFLKSC